MSTERKSFTNGKHCHNCNAAIPSGAPYYLISQSGNVVRCKKCEDEWFDKTFPEKAEKQKRLAESKERESRLVNEIKARNAKVRQLIKFIGLLFVLPVWIIVSIISQPNYVLLLVVFFLSSIAGTFLWFAYDYYKRAGIRICKSCLEEFVPQENDIDKKCPYCGSGNSAAYL